MAYLRLGHIKEGKGENMSMGLKLAIAYIYNPDKTEGNKYVGGYNLFVNSDKCVSQAYEQMMETKSMFGKHNGRQGYHYKLSFPSTDNITPELALKITNELCSRCFSDYECAYAVHTNTDHLHSHIVFNSVGLDGYKYHYKNGDWKHIIQPVANDICNKYGLHSLDLDLNYDIRLTCKCKSYNKWAEDIGKTITSTAYPNSRIKEDIDMCICQASDYREFVELMKTKGHEYDDTHKYITVKAPGRKRTTRIINLSQDRSTYTKENIMNMINGIYLDRKDVISRLFDDWNKYNNNVKVRYMNKYDLDLSRLAEEVDLLVDNSIDSKPALNEYVAYMSAVDHELNIIRKRINNSVNKHKQAFNAYDTISASYKGYMQYKAGDSGKKTEYDLCMEAFNKLKYYDVEKLEKYRRDSQYVLEQIEEYKKHVYVNRKIANRIKDKIK